MKVKLGDLKAIEEVIVDLANNIELPIEYALKIGLVIDDYDKILSNFERYRVALVHKYGTPGENGEIKVPDEKMPVFSSEFKDLINTEVEFKPVNIPKEVLQEANFKIKLAELTALIRVGFIRNDLEDGENS